MNKGLLIHIIAAVVCMLAILYVLGGNNTGSFDGALIVFAFAVTQGWCALVCYSFEYYDKKL